MKKTLIFAIACLVAIAIILAIYVWLGAKPKPVVNIPIIPTASSTIPTSPPAQVSDIIIDTPVVNAKVNSPIIISGKALGKWFFEASFPIKLVDKNGQVLGQTIAKAQGDWMSPDYVPFIAELKFTTTSTQLAELIFRKDNPSGLPENDAQFKLPVELITTQPSMRNIILYKYDSDKDKDVNGNIACSAKGLVAESASMPTSQTPIQDTIKLLISSNLLTGSPLTGFSLSGANLVNGVLTLSFKDPNNKTSGGSCRAAILWAQIEATAKQFDGVNQVKFIPDTLFQP